MMAVRPMLNVLDEDNQIIWENTDKIFCYVCLKDITNPIDQYGLRDSAMCQKHFFDGESWNVVRDDKGNVLPFQNEAEREIVKKKKELADIEEYIEDVRQERMVYEDQLSILEDEIRNEENRADKLRLIIRRSEL